MIRLSSRYLRTRDDVYSSVDKRVEYYSQSFPGKIAAMRNGVVPGGSRWEEDDIEFVVKGQVMVK